MNTFRKGRKAKSLQYIFGSKFDEELLPVSTYAGPCSLYVFLKGEYLPDIQSSSQI